MLFDLQPERAKAQEEAKRKQEEERLTQEEIHQKQQALRQQHRETRERVIDEILQTEKDYLHSINLCFETFFHTDAFKVNIYDVYACNKVIYIQLVQLA